MSFFEKSSGGELPPAGTYYGLLSELKTEMQDDYNDPTQKVPRVKWVWTTTSFRTTDSKPVVIFEWTGPRYGNPKANLTKRLDALYPKLTPEQRQELDPAHMVNIIMAQIEIVRERNDKNEPKNVIALLKPIKSLPESSWLEEEEEEGDSGSPVSTHPAVPAPPGSVAVTPPGSAPAPTPATARPPAVSSLSDIPPDDPFGNDYLAEEQYQEILTLCQQQGRNAVNTCQRLYLVNPDKLTFEQANDLIVQLRKEGGKQTDASRQTVGAMSR